VLRRQLAQAGATLLNVEHAGQVRLTFSLPADLAAPLQRQLGDACAGRLHWHDDPTP
jgi:hypothetical protein